MTSPTTQHQSQQQPQLQAQTNTELPIEDIHIPEDINAWPPAIGWWLLVIIVVAAITALWLGIKRAIKKYRQKWSYRKAALLLLDQCFNNEHFDNQRNQETPSATEQNHLQAKVDEMMRLLKRTAMSAYPNSHVNVLHGAAWGEFLQRQCGECGDKHDVTELAQFVALQQQYQANSQVLLTDQVLTMLYQQCQLWIKQHSTTLIAETEFKDKTETKVEAASTTTGAA